MGNAATTKKGDSTESGELLHICRIYKELQRLRQNFGNDAVPLLMMGINKLLFPLSLFLYLCLLDRGESVRLFDESGQKSN